MVVLAAPGSAHAQDAPVPPVEVPRPPPLPRNVILADLGLHVVGVGYQRTLAPWIALSVSLDAYDPWVQNQNAFGLSGSEYRSDLIGAVVRVRPFFHPWSNAPSGLWISPFAQAGFGRATAAGLVQTGAVWAIGLSVGYAILLVRHLHISLGLGAQYHAAAFQGIDTSPSFGRFFPTVDIIVGYAW